MKTGLLFALYFIVLHCSLAQSWIRCSEGLPTDTAVASLVKFGDAIYAGTQHAGIYKSINNGATWTNAGFYDPIRKPIIKAFASIDTFLFAAATSNGIYKTSLHSNIWTPVNNGIPKGNGNLVMFDIINVGDTLYAGSNGGGVFTSIDTGQHWTLLYNNLGLNDHRVLSLASNDQFIFAGTAGTNYTLPDTGVAFFTPRHSGNSWTVNNTGLSRNGAHLEATTSFAANDTVAYIGTDDVGIHRSTDNGQTWHPVQGTELNGDIWAIKITGAQVYYGTSYHGIFTSDDGGLTFYENNEGLNFGNISIPELVDDFVVIEPYIYAATSTGVYKQLLDTATGLNESLDKNEVSVYVYPNPFSTEITFEITNHTSINHISIHITDILGREFNPISTDVDRNLAILQMDREIMRAGIYFYSIYDNQTLISSGKMIAQ
jgi:hypothetical protein